MKKVYQLSDPAVKKHLVYFAKLFAICAVVIILSAILGLARFPRSVYWLVSLLLLGLLVLCVNAETRFSDRLKKKPNINIKEAEKKFLITSGIVAGAVWLFLLITGLSNIFSAFIMIAIIWFDIQLCTRLWEMLRGFWSLGGTVDKTGKELPLPGDFVLHDVHTDDALSSPFGKVLIWNNAVLFVLPEMNEGIAMVEADGSVSLKKKNFWGTKIVENNLNVYTIMEAAESGMERAMRIVAEECQKNNIPVPQMGYNYMLYLPNFDRTTLVWDVDSFNQEAHTHFWNTQKKYDQYLEKAANADYFEGRACYDAADISKVLHIMNESCDIPDDADSSKGQLVADILAKACGLEQK